MHKLLKQMSDEERSLLRKEAMPEWLSPMLATLTHEHFSHPDWIYEHKLDGQRCLVFRNGRRCDILSRNRKSQNHIYPELVEALKKLDVNFIADGEIVCYRDGIDSFTALQNRMHVDDPDRKLISEHPADLYLFDILYFDGYDLTQLALRSRKTILKRALDFDKPLVYMSHRNEHGEKYLREACEKGWEGLIAKDGESQYRHSRSKKWLKFKCARGQEFVIAGFTRPEGSREGFGALLIGYSEGDDLIYAGKVGTGFSDAFLREFHGKLCRHRRKTCPFKHYEGASENITWVTPKFVAEVNFTEWTTGGKLRHPRFLGLRNDKQPRDVVREKPQPVED